MLLRRVAVAAGLALLATPATASQGFSCSAKGISLGLSYGHASVPSVINHELVVGGKVVPSAVAQGWAGENIRWVDIADPDQMAVIAKLRLKWVKQSFRGTLTYKKKTYFVTCEELG